MVGMFIQMVINKENKNNQADKIELHNVIKFEIGYLKLKTKSLNFKFWNLNY